MDVKSSNNIISNMSSTITYAITTVISIILLVIINMIIHSSSFKMNIDDETKKILMIIAIIVGIVLIVIFLIAMFFNPGARSATYGFLTKLIEYANLFMKAVQPIFKSLGSFQNIIWLFVFIFGLIIMFFIFPKDYINSYAYIILPIIIPIGLVLIYTTFISKLQGSSNSQSQGSPNSQSPMDFIHLARINFALLFLAIITFMTILYVNNPGGFIKKYLWVGIIYSVSLLLMSVVYLRNVMFTKDPDKEDKAEKTAEEDKPFWQKINPFLTFDVILLIFSLTFLVPLLSNGDVLGLKTIKNTGVIITTILFFIFLTISFVKSLYIFKTTDPTFIGKMISNNEGYKTVSKYLFFVLIGFVAIATVLYWVLVLYQHALATTNIGNIIIYTIVILIMLVLIYKLVITTSVYKDSPLFQLIFNAVFYIPCLIVALFDRIMHTIPKNKTTGAVTSGVASGISKLKASVTAPTPPIYYVILVISILLFVAYFIGPSFLKNNSQQGGKVLVNRPVEIKDATYLGSYYQLNNSVDDHSYQYALSFWFYLDSASPGTRSSYERFTNILDYGGKPKVSYNAALNTLRVTMYVGPGGSENNDTNTYSPDLPRKKLDTNGNLILYELEKVKLQKWNNVILNYNGGTLDIFYNGELVKSIIGVIPYYNNTMPQTTTTTTTTSTTTTEPTQDPAYINYDNLVLGQDEGLYGQICNVNYFKTSLNIFQINYLYKSVKDYSPPALASDNKIIPLDVNLGLGAGNISGESTIMEDLPPASGDVYPEEETHEASKEMAKATAGGNHDFFSLRWYFNANHDVYN